MNKKLCVQNENIKLSALFGIEQPDFITVTGGGGKTTLLTCLGRELKDRGSTLLTTTTKMRYPDAFDGEVIITASPTELLSRLKGRDSGLYYYAERCIEEHKVKGPAPGVLDRIFKELKDWIFLNEGDGAGGKPYKIYREWEPVIPKSTTRLIHVIGCELLGAPMTSGNIHRCPETLRGKGFDLDWFRKSMEWFAGEKLKNLDIPRFLLVNKADNGNRKKAEQLCNAAEPYFDACIAASLRERIWYQC
ncbi:selenium cofactor biosynthesis protein YqeC [Eubacterium sp. 1001713B170207_170306_E7]|uniref:selenium cofactor biosynthesis protein YqeC n=1 Tax=Eubacterium sp. 1001713B170207_170306_E7 TaxID=2787097 RepID=UPI001898E0D7|nr:selenium cofactor biosynthesis protein YqeC [Eubacterium sp. 1001713B170207_170306_E7]